MARFDVYADLAGAGYLLDVQANLLGLLNTRVVVPLLPVELAPIAVERLNPQFRIQGVDCSLVTQFMAAVAITELKSLVASLDAESNAILAAIDFLHRGW
jgi:toxin CcdB